MIYSRPLHLNRMNKSNALPAKDNKENYSSNLEGSLLNKPFPKLKKKSQLGYNQSDKTTLYSETNQSDDWVEETKNTFTQIIKEYYSDDILKFMVNEDQKNSEFLLRHSITSHLRAKMIDWMIEVLSSYKMSEECFFRSVQYMDTFFKKTNKKLQITDLHLVGVASMFTGSKYEQIYPLKINAIYDKICRKKFSKTQILEMEENILIAMDFQLQNPTSFQFSKHIMAQLPLSLKPKLKQYFYDVVVYLAKLIYHNYEFSQIQSSQLGGACVFLGLKTVEQFQTINADLFIDVIAEKCQIQCKSLLQLCERVLEYAKNFKIVYPNLTNLRKFNNVEYTHQY